MDLFAGGVGSEASPYLIANQNNLLNIGNTSLDETYYKLIDDIVLLESLTINTDNILYLDLNKNKITYSFDLNRANDSDYEGAIINLQGNTKLYIDGDGNMTFDNNYIADNANSIGYTFRLTNNASIIINSGDFYCGLTCVQLDQTSSCEINGGTFEAMLPYDNRFWILNKIDNSNSTFYVKGGTFINYDPSNSETENPDDNFLAEGYQVEKISLSSGLFQVVVKQL